MSYEVNIFFGDRSPKTLAQIAPYFSELLGGSLRKEGDRYEANSMALEFELSNRSNFLVDSNEISFSNFKFQLEITSRRSSMSIIHPVALMLTEIISNYYGGKALLCLSFTEFLGAIYRDGKLIENRFSEYPGVFAGTDWSYCGRE